MSEIAHLATRLHSIWRSRGFLGLCWFLVTRLARTQSDMVFEQRLRDQPIPTAFGANRTILIIEHENVGDPSLQDIVIQLLASESAIYRSGLQQGDLAFAVVDENRRLLHRSFVQFQTRYKTLLGETADVPLLTNCHTIPSMRGERLYPKTLCYAGAILAKRGYHRMIITCDEKNLASIRGIAHGGFILKRVIRSLIVFARFAVQKINVDQTINWRIVRI